MSEHDTSGQLTDWIVDLMSAEADPSPTRDYYLTLLRRGYGVPEAVRMAVDDLLEEVRSAVAREEPYNARAHRARLSLPSFVPLQAHRLPRPALVRRIVQERIGAYRPQPGRKPAREPRRRS
jgi:hypothetical protein